MNTHISYETAKRIKEFLGDKAPEPMGKEYWCDGYIHISPTKTKPRNGSDWPAYRLEDLLSKPFCEAMGKKGALPDKAEFMITSRAIATAIFEAYFKNNMPAVEELLMEMMGDK